MCPAGVVFHKLVHLELYTREKDWCDVLVYMLEGSPNLRVLELNSDEPKGRLRECFYAEVHYPEDWWEQLPDYLPRCLLSNLETFQWKHYRGWETETKLAAYILANAICLKMASICPAENNLEGKHRILKELASMARGSSSCQLIFND
ncbi:PREDICTED: F-box/FBD/LRR-repeat protein At4g26340-like [Tarenaya hassleriana]|uniref:F-box/FBD/LRR-repeat protein At4g26340-like n=1 Tax=Tarenaya hassleriana TaxID=28532 RepID=UPI00053C1BB8|nr:PREDICTED: F-box/FBD/LRR-repeat protein At4g26340-like [Tarenaya hassleriana]